MSLSPDERATLTNMATECARTGICVADEAGPVARGRRLVTCPPGDPLLPLAIFPRLSGGNEILRSVPTTWSPFLGLTAKQGRLPHCGMRFQHAGQRQVRCGFPR